MALDDLFEEFDKFELEDAAKLTPREYARIRSMAPQLVYYYIRNGVVDVERCVCGRKVIDVERTDKALEARKKAPGEGLHSGESVET